MSKTVSPQMIAYMKSHAQTLCTCVRVIRKDGVVMGFTNHDQGFNYTMTTSPDSYGSTYYSPKTGVRPSSGKTSSDTSVDNIQLTGFIDKSGIYDSELISEQDIIAGVYEEAQILFFEVNYEDFTMGERIKRQGVIGKYNYDNGIFNFEILGYMSYAKKSIGQVTSPTCRVQRFCDNQCGLNPASYTAYGFVSDDDDGALTRYRFPIAVGSLPTPFIWPGAILKIGNIEREVKAYDGTFVILKEAWPFMPVADADLSVLSACDRKFATCDATYHNAPNFRGEPFLPGNDQIGIQGKA